MRRLLVPAVCLAALLAGSAVAAPTLNKCIDVQGKVTYSNLPCKNARETQKVEIDPPPLPDPAPIRPLVVHPTPQPENAPSVTQTAPPITPPAAQPARETPPARKPDAPATGKLKPTAANTCDTLADRLGRVFDKMDAARRKGYTQEQMDDWNRQIKDLEHQKQRVGCF